MTEYRTSLVERRRAGEWFMNLSKMLRFVLSFFFPRYGPRTGWSEALINDPELLPRLANGVKIARNVSWAVWRVDKTDVRMCRTELLVFSYSCRRRRLLGI